MYKYSRYARRKWSLDKMLFLVFYFAVPVFGHTASGKAKSVNLALETVLEFDKQNLDSDVKIIDNVQKFLSKVRNVLDANRIDTRRRMGRPYLQFTDFLHSCIDIIKSYNDKDLKEFAEAFDNEIRKYHYKGCKFYELLDTNDARKIISEKLEEFRNHPPKKLRKVLGKFQKKLQVNSDKGKVLADLVNSLYRIDSQTKFKTFIDNLEAYKAKDQKDNSNDLHKIVKNGIRALLFDHYSNLNPNVRQDVRMQINEFFNNGKSNDIGETNDNVNTDFESNFMKHQDITRQKVDKDLVSKKHKLSKLINQEMEHDIEAEVTNKWLFGEITTAKPKKKKMHRHGKHSNVKRTKKHKKHKKKKAQQTDITEHPPNQPLRMSPNVEERILPEKKETTKYKTIMRIREDKPLKEIISENNAEIYVGHDITRRAGPPIMNKILPSKKEKTTSFRADESDHSEQDKKDGLSIEAWRRENYHRRAIDESTTKEFKTKTTAIDPDVLKKIHNLEEELLNVKKKIRQQKESSSSSESESEDSDEATTKTTKATKPYSTTTPTSTTTSTTRTTTESSSEVSSSESDEKKRQTKITKNITTTTETTTITTTSKTTTSPTVPTTTTKIPATNSTLEWDKRAHTKTETTKDFRKNINATTAIVTQIPGVVITRNDVFEIKFNIKHDASLTSVTTAKAVYLKSRNDATTLNVTSSTVTPDLDVISVLNSTMSNQEKVKELENLRQKIEMMSDDDPNTISKE